jgi:hypothetical protein
MADEKSELPPASTEPSAPSTAPLSAPAPALAPVFEADAFLAAKTKPSAHDKAAPAVAAANPPQVIKRGGVGFVTALAMSILAAGGGAYLALLAGSRPDLLQQAGVANFLPKPAAAVAPQGSSELLAIQTRLGTTPTTGPAVPVPPDVAPKSGDTNTISPPVGATMTPSAPLNTADIGVMKGELQGISGRVIAIETRLAALDPTGAGGAVVAGLQADIASLKSIIGTLQQQAATAPSPAVTFALINIAEAANRSGPFMVEYETLRAAMPGAPEVVALEPFARTGVPTRQLLEERFAALGPAVVAAAAADKKESGLVAWIRSLFADMVKVQPAPDANGTGSNGAVDRAKVKLDQGDYAGAIDALNSVVGAPSVVTEWVSGAKKRLELESRISAVRGAAARVPVAGAPTPQSAPQAPLIGGQIPALPSLQAQPAAPPVANVQGQNP